MGIDDFIADLSRLSQRLDSPEIAQNLGNKLVNSLANALGASGLKQQTGNLYKGIIAISPVEKTARGYAIGVGNLEVLGTETDLTPPNTIRDFLGFLAEIKIAEGQRNQARALEKAKVRRSLAAKKGARTKRNNAAGLRRELSKATAGERQAARDLARFEARTAARDARLQAEIEKHGLVEVKGGFAASNQEFHKNRLSNFAKAYGKSFEYYKAGKLVEQTHYADAQARRIADKMKANVFRVTNAALKAGLLQDVIHERLRQAANERDAIEKAYQKHTAAVAARYAKRSRK